MKGGELPGLEVSLTAAMDLQDVVLLPGETLKLHMDCMNSYGQIITIDDVDEMGGSVSRFNKCEHFKSKFK